ncbi:MAG: hypothetical protein CMJ89_09655 [Planctomycetes bacterium]|jgi:hypothetical protein|nr:hypothetical protein [Planctomycetota bacterium]
MKLSSILLSVSTLLFSSACGASWSHRAVQGSGIRTEESREVGDFHSVSLRTSGEVLVEVGPQPSISIITDDNLLPLISTQVSSGELTIESENVRTKQEPRFHITTPRLDAFGISGSARVRIRGINEKKFEARISGSGDTEIDGTVEQLGVSISGSGELDLRRLEATQADVRISGSARVRLNVTQTLNYQISGSGNIRYSGDARATGSVSGTGSIAQD